MTLKLEKTGDHVAQVGSHEVRLRPPVPGRSEWWELQLDGVGLVYRRADQQADALARARMLVQLLDTSTPVRNRVAREEVVARVDLVGEGAAR